MVREAKAGNEESLEKVLWEHFSELERYLKPQMPNDLQSFVSIDDVISQTFFEACRDFDKFLSLPFSMYATCGGLQVE